MVNKSLVAVLALAAVLVGLNYSGLVNKQVISSFMEKNEVTLCFFGCLLARACLRIPK